MLSGSPTLDKLVDELSKLPGIGRKSARRLAYFFLKQDRKNVAEMAEALLAAKDNIRECEKCHTLTEVSPCYICSDERRDRSLICVVEEASDLMAIERSGQYRGLYHVLGGVISPLDGVGPEDLKIKDLLARMRGVKEVIMATNPSMEGETTTLYISKQLKPYGVKVTRIARGIPMGSALEHTDQVTLHRAIEGRMEVREESES